MTLHSLDWYRVKESRQYCQVASIMSTSAPQNQVKSATESMKAFHVALIWYTPPNDVPGEWTKRAIVMELKKAFGLLRGPTEEDLPIIDRLKKIANDMPLHSISVDGVKIKSGLSHEG
jgi:hypothetical protein